MQSWKAIRYAQRLQTAGALGFLLAAVAVAFADSSIVVLALPDLLDEFHISIGSVAWVVTSYNLVLALATLALARVAPRFEAARMAFLGAGIFLVSSLACALAPSIWVLFAARALQGLGAGSYWSVRYRSPAPWRRRRSGEPHSGRQRASSARHWSGARGRAHRGLRVAGDLRCAGSRGGARPGRRAPGTDRGDADVAVGDRGAHGHDAQREWPLRWRRPPWSACSSWPSCSWSTCGVSRR